MIDPSTYLLLQRWNYDLLIAIGMLPDASGDSKLRELDNKIHTVQAGISQLLDLTMEDRKK